MSKGNGKPCIRCGSHDWDTRGSCRECARARGRKWYRENKERAKKTSREWYLKNKEYFYQLQAESRKRHPETNRKRVAKWQKDNPDKRHEHRMLRIQREANAGGSHTHDEWIFLLGQFDYACANCGSKEDVCRDHIIPVAHGGTSDISNIQPLCRACNSHKGLKHTDYRKP